MFRRPAAAGAITGKENAQTLCFCAFPGMRARCWKYPSPAGACG